MECVRQYINEVLDFMADMHTLTKLKVRGLTYTAHFSGEQDRGSFRDLHRPDDTYCYLGRQLWCSLTVPVLGAWRTEFSLRKREKRKERLFAWQEFCAWLYFGHSFSSPAEPC